MDIAPVEAILAEATAALADLGLPVEGLEDLSDDKIKDSTKAAVTTNQEAYKLRSNRLISVIERSNNLINAMNALFADGYPHTPIAEVSTKM